MERGSDDVTLVYASNTITGLKLDFINFAVRVKIKYSKLQLFTVLFDSVLY